MRAARAETAATTTKRMVSEYGATAPPPAPVTIYRTPATISAIATAAIGSMRSFVCERQKDRGMGPQWMLALGIGASAALLVAMAPRDPRGCYEATAPLGLRRVAVASDGSCLYHAVGCALASAGINFGDFEAAVERIRAGVWAAYLARGGGTNDKLVEMGPNGYLLVVIDQGRVEYH